MMPRIYVLIFVLFADSALCATDFICGSKVCADQQKTATLILKFKQGAAKKRIDDTSIYPFVVCSAFALSLIGYHINQWLVYWYNRNRINQQYELLTFLNNWYTQIQIMYMMFDLQSQQNRGTPIGSNEVLAAAPAA